MQFCKTMLPDQRTKRRTKELIKKDARLRRFLRQLPDKPHVHKTMISRHPFLKVSNLEIVQACEDGTNLPLRELMCKGIVRLVCQEQAILDCQPARLSEETISHMIGAADVQALRLCQQLGGIPDFRTAHFGFMVDHTRMMIFRVPGLQKEGEWILGLTSFDKSAVMGGPVAYWQFPAAGVCTLSS